MRSIVAVSLASFIGAGALAQIPEAEGKPHTLVLVVLHPVQKGQKPLEPAEFGGSLKTRAGSRLAVLVPEAAIEGLKRDPRVKYVQRVISGDASPVAAASTRMTVAAESAGSPEVAVNGTGSVTIGPYAYDGSGNVYEIGGTLTGADRIDTFTYDQAGRLKTATVHAFDVARTESYVYDSAGNLTRLHTGGTVIELPVDASTNRLRSSHGFEYDGVGNMIGVPLGDDYQYDHVEMLKSTNSHQYIYTADDERLAVTSRADADQQPWKWTVRDLSKKPVREYESFGEIFNDPDFLWKNDHFYGGGTAVAAQRETAEGGLRHFHADHLGTPRLITNGAGDRISTHVYYPFGVEISSVTQERALGYEDEEHIAFTGHERDGMENGGVDHSQYLDYMHARYYNPNWGRFLSVDPAWESADLGKPQSWNRYAYVTNNPVNLTDPDGKCPFCIDPVEAGKAIYATGAEFVTKYVLDAESFGDGEVLSKEQRLAYLEQRAKNAPGGTGSSDEILTRQTKNESAKRLAERAAAAEKKIGIHGVSASAAPRQPGDVAEAHRSDVEKVFKVHDTPTRRDPLHKTIELPKPVTNKVARLFNTLFRHLF